MTNRTDTTPESKHDIIPSRRRPACRIALGLLGAALLVAVLFFLFVGRWLVVEDPLQKAQAIVVLSGRMPIRAMEAAKLYREGYAPKVWLTHSTEPGASLAPLGIQYVGEDSYDKQVLAHEGVPPDAIRVLEPPIVNTADEIADISAAMAQEKDTTVIIVTSKPHTRRVRILWRRLTAGPERAIIRAASDDPFEPARWWRSTGDALDVLRECLGILNAWAGLPLHPAR
ncbi:MAG: YdcF family protein [Candidatus Acidiferrum sp.]